MGCMSEVEPLVSSPELDRRLLRNARKSPAEIEKITGIPAAEVAERLSLLLDQRNWRDDLMEEKLLIVQATDLIHDLQSRMTHVEDDESYASLARVLTSNVKLMLDQIERRRKNIDTDLQRVTIAQAQLMANAISLAAERAVLELEKMFPDVPSETVREAFEQGIPEAVKLLEAKSQ